MNRVAVLLIGLAVVVLLAACGSAGASPTVVPDPSGALSTAPPAWGGSPAIPSPTQSPATTGPGESAGASPSDSASASAEPSAGFESPLETEAPEGSHVAPDLEALLPSTLGGATLATESDTGDVLLDAWTRVMVSFLADAGKTAEDLQFAQAWDAEAGVDVSLMAFRVAGVAGPALRDVITEGLMAGSPEMPKTSETVSGKNVTRLTSPEDGWTTYLYEKDGVVYLVGTTDSALAGSALAALP